MRKIEKLDIIGCQSSQGEIREKINLIIDRLNEEEPRECEGYHPSKPDSYLGGTNLYPESDKSQKYHREGCDPNIPRSYPCNCDEEPKPDKLQRLLEWVEENKYTDQYGSKRWFEVDYLSLIDKIKELMDEE